MPSQIEVENRYLILPGIFEDRRASRIIAIGIILITCCLLLWNSRTTNFLDCKMECGESLLAARSAELFREQGVTYGLLENMGTLKDPSVYTHNVNVGGYLLIAAEILGVPGRYFFVTALLVFGLGLYYVYATFLYFTKSNLAALIALTAFASTYWGLGTFALNPLRAWHLIAFFAVFLHTSQILSNARSKLSIAGLVFGALAAFGCGYDFWIICGATAASVIVLSTDSSLTQKARVTFMVAAAFAAPFLLRQIQVAMALGADYWAQDFIYSVAIKVPYADRLIKIPSLDEIDAYYRAHHVMRPPAQPGNTAWQIFFTFRHMVEFITIPRWGLLTLGITTACAMASLLPFFRKNIFVAISYRMILPMLVGPAIGLIALSPFALHVYFKHEFPLLAFPLIAAKSLLLYILIKVVLERNHVILSMVAAACVLAIGLDAALVHWNNTYHSEYPNFAWIKFYKGHKQEDVALSTYQMMGYATPYLEATQSPTTYFEQQRVRLGEEPNEPFWIYQPVDYMTDFDRTMPRCRWTGWLRELRGQRFPSKPGISCVYDQVFIPTAKPAPLTLDEVAASVKTYEVIDRNDMGIGYLVMKKKS